MNENPSSEWNRAQIPDAETGEPITLRSLVDICPGGPDPALTLLGDRYLCKAGGMLFIGPSGIGKSSASAQQDVLWALGRPAFGIKPARALKILTIQAENDDGDLREMYAGVKHGLRLSTADEDALRDRVIYETHRTSTGPLFLSRVDELLDDRGFDIVRIDPFQSYLGADVANQEKTTKFLSEGLNPILEKYQVGCVLNHHTPKTTHRDTTNWRASDWMYAGAGSAAITNWARAVMVIDPTHAPGVFKFHAAKRGARIGWADEYGNREVARHFCHASDAMYWREANPEDLQEVEAAAEANRSGKTKKTAEDLKALVPMAGSIPKNTFRQIAVTNGFAVNSINPMLAELFNRGELYEWHVRRPGTNPERQISRHVQSLLNGH